ncbi:MAG: phospholipase D-like domain-containing protein [Salinivirgaceae bacterium]|nr:phospholipase D-like domain-containing protein [Salinivirgaceae bacterium]
MNKVKYEIAEYFVKHIGERFQDQIPQEIIDKINQIDRVGRGDMKKLLFNYAHRLSVRRPELDTLIWLENCFDTIDRYTFRFHHAYFSPSDDIPTTILDLIRHAHRSIDVCIYTISYKPLATELVEARNRGIKVRLVSDINKTTDTGSMISFLQKKHIPLRTNHSQHLMHNKFGIIDSRLLFTGSFNWTYTAIKHNQENLLVTSNYALVQQYKTEFEKLWHTIHKPYNK